MSNGKKEFIIYALHHDNSDCVYVGKSSYGLRRPKLHSMPSAIRLYPDSPVTKWIVKRQSLGQKYSICILEELSSVDQLDEAEKFYIAYFKSIGTKLLNATEGGEGTPGYKHTEEARKKISKAGKGRIVSEETRQKMSDSLKGRIITPEMRARLVEVNTGKTHSAETKQKLAEIAANMSKETRQKIANTLTGRKRPPEVIAKIKATHNLPEVKAKHSKTCADKRDAIARRYTDES